MNKHRRNQLIAYCREELSESDRKYILDHYREKTDLEISIDLEKPIDIITTFVTVFGCNRNKVMKQKNAIQKGRVPKKGPKISAESHKPGSAHRKVITDGHVLHKPRLPE